MKKSKRIKYILFFTIAISSFVLVYTILNDGENHTATVRASETFTSQELLLEFEFKQENLKNFIEKAIEVEGEIKEITFQDGKYSLILKGESEKTFILCEMQADQSAAVVQLEAGQTVKLKGILKGFLLDIILLHCVIV